jgi:hypothetical protein
MSTIINQQGDDGEGELLQYWYTQSVAGVGPQGPGVYEQVVMAPRLAGRFGTGEIGIAMVEIGDPPRLELATPEPGMGWALFMLLVVAMVARGIGWKEPK